MINIFTNSRFRVEQFIFGSIRRFSKSSPVSGIEVTVGSKGVCGVGLWPAQPLKAAVATTIEGNNDNRMG